MYYIRYFDVLLERDFTEIVSKHTFTEEHELLLRRIIGAIDYWYHLKPFPVFLLGNEEVRLVIRNTSILAKILDYNLDYLLLMKKSDTFYVLDLPTEEMLQLKLVI